MDAHMKATEHKRCWGTHLNIGFGQISADTTFDGRRIHGRLSLPRLHKGIRFSQSPVSTSQAEILQHRWICTELEHILPLLTVGNLPPLSPSFSAQTPTTKFPRLPTSENCGFSLDSTFTSSVHCREAANTARQLLFMVRRSFCELSKQRLSRYTLPQCGHTWNMQWKPTPRYWELIVTTSSWPSRFSKVKLTLARLTSSSALPEPG